ncbi:MAG: hypothetical protein ACXV6L_01580 [Halobacteriota archaeon]
MENGRSATAAPASHDLVSAAALSLGDGIGVDWWTSIFAVGVGVGDEVGEAVLVFMETQPATDSDAIMITTMATVSFFIIF